MSFAIIMLLMLGIILTVGSEKDENPSKAKNQKIGGLVLLISALLLSIFDLIVD
jgi:uncharacterized membrane protein